MAYRVLINTNEGLQGFDIEGTGHTVMEGNLEIGNQGERVAYFPIGNWVGVLRLNPVITDPGDQEPPTGGIRPPLTEEQQAQYQR